MGTKEENRKYYQQNKELYKEKARRQRQRSRDFVREYRLNVACIICGESESCCLDFHHTDPNQKDMDLGRAVNNGWSVERLMNEIEKCVVVCSNCHRKIHAGLIEL